MKNTNYVFMAMAGGSESKEAAVIKRYIGVAPVTVLAVNPKKEKLEELYGTTLDKEPEYVGTTTINDKEVPQVRIDFIVKTVAEKCNGIDMTTKLSFYVAKAARYDKNNTKVQVIDKYGRTCWVTKEELQNHAIPQYKNGPANIDPDYRACYIGEEELTNFIRLYLNIPDVMKYVNETWIKVDNPQDSEARLDHVADYFKGHFDELEGAIALQPTNKIKVLFGVKTNDKGAQYQTFYTPMFLRNSTNNYTRLDKDLQERLKNGAFKSSVFIVCPIREYDVEATTFSTPTAQAQPAPTTAPSDLPFDVPTEKAPWEV